MPDELTPEIFTSLRHEGYDGLIASEPGRDETARLILESDIPVSFIGDPGPILGKRKSRIIFTRNDDEFIGHMGARYLVSLGAHRTYGFVPTTSRQYWSAARLKGFQDELDARGLTTEVFRSPGWPAATMIWPRCGTG
jgi:DNA-binding LacI/PurR family transcriptional regulator